MRQHCTVRTVYCIRYAVSVPYCTCELPLDQIHDQWLGSELSPLTSHLSVTCHILLINHLSLILLFGHCTPHSALEHRSTGAVDNWCAIAGGLLDADNRADSFDALM